MLSSNSEGHYMSRSWKYLAVLLVSFAALLQGGSAFGLQFLPGDFAPESPLRVERSDFTAVELSLEIDALQRQPLHVQGERFDLLSIADYGHTSELGRPRLPMLREFIEIPHGAEYELIAEELRVEEVRLGTRILPAQAPVPKLAGAREQAPFLLDNLTYATDSYQLEAPARLGEEIVMRGRRLVVLEIFPVDHNPVAGTVRVATEMRLSLRFTEADEVEASERLSRLSSPASDAVIHRVVLNARQFEARLMVDPNMTPPDGIGFLMIADPSFMGNSSLQSLVALRNSGGFDVTLVDTNTTGSSASAIKNYIQQAYNQEGIEFVLLIGDTNLIPHWTGSGSYNPTTDLNYACVDGSDYVPDVTRGRFPVRTNAQLDRLCNKVIAMSSESVKEAVFMASEDNYRISEGTHNYCINTHLNPENWASDKLYCHTYNATTQQVRNAFNEGRTVGVYSGHGYSGGWSDGPAFNQSDVRNLVNSIYPFVQSFACSTGPFNMTECFAETWVVDDAGAAAFFGASESSYWDEDDILERRMFDGCFDLGHDRVGTMIDYGQYELYLYYGNNSFMRMYYEMYNLMGDPSMPVISGGGPDAPVPDIKINGMDDPPNVPEGTTTNVTVSLDPGDAQGVQSDWWIWVQRPSGGKWWYVHPTGWQQSQDPLRAGAIGLRTLNNVNLFDGALPRGTWEFTFAIDALDGVYGEDYVDRVDIVVY